ncbi:hypothetical protein HDV04_000155 [Boothiomyces sp. JEL0838]|nr:hypothetical protein HDV04_000155 [Boothiomyces sp. JEL0838]
MFLYFGIAICLFIFLIWPESYAKQCKKLGKPADYNPISFFHPFCDSGGGGERVLWTAIDAIQQSYPQKEIVIYIWSNADTDNLLDRVEKQFGFVLDADRIMFLKLYTWPFLESKRYKRLTLIASSLGSMVSGWEAFTILCPKLMIESVGFAFIYPIAKLFGCKLVSYVHYPTISSDMLKRVRNREDAFNNSSTISNSKFLSTLKLWYYLSFSKIYGLVGSCCDVVMVNSTWTRNHIDEIWKLESRTKIVYPPCDTLSLIKFELDPDSRQRIILSVAQFRPEKDHELQINCFSELLKRYPEYSKGKKAVKLVLIGGVRNQGDQERVDKLQTMIDNLHLKDNVEIVKNAPYELLLNYLSVSLIGIHTMHNEHFGISLIEYMAAGLITVGNKSGGPLMDIVTKGNGYLASDLESYVQCLKQILDLPAKERAKIQASARRHVQSKFSEASFKEGFLDSIKSLI